MSKPDHVCGTPDAMCDADCMREAGVWPMCEADCDRMERAAIAIEQLTAALETFTPLMRKLESYFEGEHAGEYESEYDGRTYTCCIGCNYNDSHGEHAPDCEVAKFRSLFEAASAALHLYRDQQAVGEERG